MWTFYSGGLELGTVTKILKYHFTIIALNPTSFHFIATHLLHYISEVHFAYFTTLHSVQFIVSYSLESVNKILPIHLPKYLGLQLMIITIIFT